MSSTPTLSGKFDVIRRFPEPWSVLELLKPVTWFPPMWAFFCGVVSSGVEFSGNGMLILFGILLAGPLVCAMSQAINDWYDRHVDAINEPDRPIPSGRIPGRWGLYIALIWTLISLVVASFLGTWVLAAAVLGLFLAWAYSAPPLRFKQNGWIGNAAVGFSYEGLAWFTGAAVMIGGFPGWEITLLAILYSLGAHGIMTLNDFKSIGGDHQMGVRSLPVILGVEGAARVACLAMAIPQLVVIALLFFWGLNNSALLVGGVLIAQLFFMRKYLMDRTQLMQEPVRKAALYNLTGVTLYITGMMISAVGVGSIMTMGQA